MHVIDRERSEALQPMIHRFAHALLAAGVGPDDRVLWCGPNSIEVLAVTLACRRIDAVAVPLPYRLTPDEADYIVGHCQPKAAWVDPEYDHLAPAVPRVAPADDDSPPAAEPSQFVRLIIYTSGTTGRPKGAVRTIGGSEGQFGALLELLGWRDHPVVYLTTGPLYHSGPLGFALRALYVDGTVVTQRHFDADGWLDLVARHRVTTTFAAPTPIRRVVALPDEVKARYDRSSMRCMIANAAPWSMALKEAYLADFPPESLWEIYGSTELSVCTALPPADQLRKPGSCGRPAPGVELALFGPEGDRITEPDTPGELYVRSPAVFDTYLDDDARYAADHRDGFHTVGDIAYVDDEGYYFICDRKTDMVISGGVNVYSAEVEAALDASPLVVDVAVIGLPDEEWGEVVHAVVVPAGPDVTAEAVLADARTRLAGYKVPKGVTFVDELPTTGSGKVRKRDLRNSLS